MKKLLIEWKHFDKNGATCDRCNQTGKNLKLAIKELRKEYSSEEIDIEYKETKLTEDRMPESNQILINEQLLESLIPEAKSGENCCSSCADLIENSQSCNCRTVNIGSDIHEEIPVDLITQAVENAIQLKQKGGI